MSQLILDEGAAPSTPATGKVSVYAKADGRLYIKTDAGVEFPLASGAPQTLVDGASISCDISTGEVFDLTIAGNRTINFTGGSSDLDGKKIILRIKQDATGSRLITWGTGARFGTDITEVVLSTTAAKTDMVGLIYNHAATSYDIIAFARGY